VLVTGFIKDILYSIVTSKTVDTTTGVVSEVRKVTVIDKVSGSIINKFEDYIPDLSLNKFVRTLENNSVIHYSCDEQILFLPKVNPVPIIPSLAKDDNCFANFIALDLETVRMSDGRLVIETAAISDGRTSNAWHIMDYTNTFGDLQSCNRLLKDLLAALVQINIFFVTS